MLVRAHSTSPDHILPTEVQDRRSEDVLDRLLVREADQADALRAVG
jgi:hypothetical protein